MRIFFLLALFSLNLKANECSSMFSSNASAKEILEMKKQAQEDFKRASLKLKEGGIDWQPLSKETINKVESLVQEYHRNVEASKDLSAPIDVQKIASSIKKAADTKITLESFLVSSGIILSTARDKNGPITFLLLTKKDVELNENLQSTSYDYTLYDTSQRLDIIRSEHLRSESFLQIIEELTLSNRRIKFFGP